MDWAGEKVWVHEKWLGDDGGKYSTNTNLALEAAHPGLHIYEARLMRHTVFCERTERPDAKPAMRHSYAWDHGCRP